MLDDEPVTLKTTHKPVVALPYNFEIHDIVLFTAQYHPSPMFYDRAMDQFNVLYEEAAERPKIMAMACHPYLSGRAAPHRPCRARVLLKFCPSPASCPGPASKSSTGISASRKHHNVRSHPLGLRAA